MWKSSQSSCGEPDGPELSQRLLLKSFTGDDARVAFEEATPTIARFMAWDPAASPEAFAPIWQSWIATIVAFACDALNKRAVLYPMVQQNDPSRRLAERLGGRIIGPRLLRKGPGVVYRIPAPMPG
jgi:hypothetical protein